MPDYQPATLIPVDGQAEAPTVISGEAVVSVARSTRGEVQLSGTFKSEDARLKSSGQAVQVPYHYAGVAFEGDKRCEVEAKVFVTHHENGLHEFTSLAETVIVKWLD